MRRVPEPELMEGQEQARAYAHADFEEPHSRFLTLLQETLPAREVGPWVVDLGCGAADISIRVARAFPCLQGPRRRRLPGHARLRPASYPRCES